MVPLARHRATIVDNYILNRCAIVQHTEQTDILLLGQVDDHVAHEVLLPVEGSTESTARRTDGLVANATHVDVGSEHCAHGTIATGNNVREIFQILGIANLVDSVFLIQGISLGNAQPSTQDGKKRDKRNLLHNAKGFSSYFGY